MRTATRVDRVEALSQGDREAMFALFERYYDRVTSAQFEKDLAGKQRVIRLFHPDGRLVGFSTIQLIRTELGGQRLLTIFSGDTVVDRSSWGGKALQRAFTGFLLRTKLTHPRTRVFWFLISKGYKTYLLMRNNLTSYPNFEAETPADVKAVLDHVATLKYPGHYDPRRGLIVFPRSEGMVRPEFEDLSASDLRKPDIRFFVERNPGYAEGDELCCLAEVKLRELLAAGLKYAVGRPVARLASRVRAFVARGGARTGEALGALGARPRPSLRLIDSRERA